jgi:hypothetical protein
MKARRRYSQHVSPLIAWIPSFAITGTITMAAARSAHHHPREAFRSSPINRMAERYTQKSVCLASACIAVLPSSWPYRTVTGCHRTPSTSTPDFAAWEIDSVCFFRVGQHVELQKGQKSPASVGASRSKTCLCRLDVRRCTKAPDGKDLISFRGSADQMHQRAEVRAEVIGPDHDRENPFPKSQV